jgi:aryl-alcohol dehydrogenase-like predicted oxidoreductase
MWNAQSRPLRHPARGRAAELLWCARTAGRSSTALDGGPAQRLFHEGACRAPSRRRLALRSPEFQGELLRRNLALAAALGPVAERHHTTVAAVAVAWTLAWPGVTGAIVGARRPAEIDGWLDAAALDLTASDLDEIAGAITRTGAGAGPVRPS